MTHKAIAHNLLTVAQPVPEQRKDHSFAQFGSALLLLSPPSSEGAKKSLTPCKHCSATTKTCVLSALSSSYTHNTASYQLLGRRLTPSQPKTKTCSFTTKTISLFLAQQSHSIQFLLRTLQNNPLTFHKISSYSHYFSFMKKKKSPPWPWSTGNKCTWPVLPKDQSQCAFNPSTVWSTTTIPPSLIDWTFTNNN